MAIVLNDYYEVTFGFEDATGSKSSTNGYLPSTLPIADARTRATALGNAIVGASGCKLASLSITQSGKETDPAVLPLAGSRVEQKGKLQFITDKGKRTTISVPAPVDAIVTDEGRLQEDVVGLDAVLDEIIGGGWCDTNGRDITALIAAYEGFRSSTRRMLPSKRNPDADTDPAT